jgi:hypothetical protein
VGGSGDTVSEWCGSRPVPRGMDFRFAFSTPTNYVNCQNYTAQGMGVGGEVIADERLTHDQRVWYALQGVAGLRPGEAAPLRWSHYEPDLKPLGRLLIANSNKRLRTKTGAVRQVPVHPTLAKMLAEWKLHGWPAMMGRHPGSEDLLIPADAARRVVLGSMRNRNTWSHQTRRDLLTLGLRHRRGYDLRRTFISLARTDGARTDLLKLVTHGSDSQRNMMDLYSTFDWPVLCAEVAKLNVRLEARGKVVQLRQAAAGGASPVEGAAGASGGVSSPQGLATLFATPANETLRFTASDGFRRRDSNSCQQPPLTGRSCSSFGASLRIRCRIGQRQIPRQSTPVSPSRPVSWRRFGNRDSACIEYAHLSARRHLHGRQGTGTSHLSGAQVDTPAPTTVSPAVSATCTMLPSPGSNRCTMVSTRSGAVKR